ncbi:hypothetical protein PDE01_45310 [Paracoccus denitrificans]|nr:hypothetical protein PDE01_45310 [Paracoccus denitrificans]
MREDQRQGQRLATQQVGIDKGQPGLAQTVAHLAQGMLQMGRGGLVRPQMYAQGMGSQRRIGARA